MNPKLRLHHDAAEPAPTPSQGQATLKFPAGAMAAIKRRNHTKNTPPRPLSFNGHADLVRQVEATLDRMQERLDNVKDQIGNYRFPVERLSESDRPRAA